jgi:hypothetical protein
MEFNFPRGGRRPNRLIFNEGAYKSIFRSLALSSAKTSNDLMLGWRM